MIMTDLFQPRCQNNLIEESPALRDAAALPFPPQNAQTLESWKARIGNEEKNKEKKKGISARLSK